MYKHFYWATNVYHHLYDLTLAKADNFLAFNCVWESPFTYHSIFCHFTRIQTFRSLQNLSQRHKSPSSKALSEPLVLVPKLIIFFLIISVANDFCWGKIKYYSAEVGLASKNVTRDFDISWGHVYTVKTPTLHIALLEWPHSITNVLFFIINIFILKTKIRVLLQQIHVCIPSVLQCWQRSSRTFYYPFQLGYYCSKLLLSYW